MAPRPWLLVRMPAGMARRAQELAPRRSRRRSQPLERAPAACPSPLSAPPLPRVPAEPQAPPAKKLSKHAKKKAHADREKEIRQAELHRLEVRRRPQQPARSASSSLPPPLPPSIARPGAAAAAAAASSSS